MVSENRWWYHTIKNTTKHPRLHKTNINKGRPKNKKSPVKSGLFGLYGIVLDYHLAERVGFEPTVHLRAQRFSRPSDSTTLAPLRMFYNNPVDILIPRLMIVISNMYTKLLFLGSEYNKITILFLTDIFTQRVYAGLLFSFSAELEPGVPMRVLAGEMVVEFGGIQKTCTL